MKCELSCCLDVEDPILADIPLALGQLVGFLRDHGVTDDLFISQFELAAAEAINNATEHGCSETEGRFFRARLYLKADHVELRVLDPSDFKGWNTEPALPEDSFVESGRGHFIMSQLSDEMLHESENGCHVLILRKYFRNTSWEYVPGSADMVVSNLADEVVSSYELITTLVGLGEWLAMAPDIPSFINGTLEMLCSVTGADMVCVRIEEKGNLKMYHQYGNAIKSLPEVLDLEDQGVEAAVFRTRKEITLLSNYQFGEGDPLAGAFLSGFVTPIIFKDKYCGILVMGRTTPAPFFDAGKLKISRMVADYIGIILAMGELQRRKASEQLALRDLEIAAQIQLSLMPKDFSFIQGLDIYGTCIPALKAGGDYFDMICLPDKSILCIVADVMGKGITAALLANMLRTNLYAIVASGIADPGEINAQINKLMCKDLMKLEMFITLTCVLVSSDRGRIYSSSAGHLTSLLQKEDQSIVEIEGTGIPLGIFHNTDYTSTITAFEEGDRLLLYTDGIIEAMDTKKSLFEMEGIKASLSDSRRLSSKESVENLMKEVAHFSEHMPQSDDRTMMIITRNQTER